MKELYAHVQSTHELSALLAQFLWNSFGEQRTFVSLYISIIMIAKEAHIDQLLIDRH